jgi:uncharacterized lipoprotein YajG
MKTTMSLIVALACSLFLCGCNKNDRSTVDTSKLEQSFSTAEPDQKASADKVVASIKQKDYSGAMAELKQLTANAKLTPEQKQSITDTLKQLQREFTDTAKKVADDAKAGLDKALKK